MSAYILFTLFASLLGFTLALPRQTARWWAGAEGRSRFQDAQRLPAENVSCIDAAPYTEKPYPIHYAHIQPFGNLANYKIDELWYKDHFVSGPHYMGVSHGLSPYADFKCQYTCNGEPACKSFFGYYGRALIQPDGPPGLAKLDESRTANSPPPRVEDVNTSNEHHQCVLFNAILEPQDLILSSDANTLPSGAFDRLCSPPP